MITSNEIMDLKKKLGLLQEFDCTYSETEEYRKLLEQGLPLPDGVLRKNPDSSIESAGFYTIQASELSKDEIFEYLQYKQLASLITIKNCVVFFTVLTIISLVVGLLFALILL